MEWVNPIASSLYAKMEQGLKEWQKRIIRKLVTRYQFGEILFPAGAGMYRIPVGSFIEDKDQILYDGWFFLHDHNYESCRAGYADIPEREWRWLLNYSDVERVEKSVWPRLLSVHCIYDYFLRWVI